jgi:hypothetical protein
MTILDLPYNNITLVNFNEIFYNEIHPLIYSDIIKYNLLGKNLKNSDVKKIFYHYIIHVLCEKVLSKFNNKPVFIFCNTFIKDCTIVQAYGKDSVLKFLESFIKKLECMLPFKFCIIPYNLSELSYVSIPYDLILNSFISKQKNTDSKSYTFEKIKKFAKQHNLTFLDNDYLNRLKTKHVLI